MTSRRITVTPEGETLEAIEVRRKQCGSYAGAVMKLVTVGLSAENQPDDVRELREKVTELEATVCVLTESAISPDKIRAVFDRYSLRLITRENDAERFELASEALTEIRGML